MTDAELLHTCLRHYFLAGSYSHAALKRPAIGHIFVQECLGGSTTSATPNGRMTLTNPKPAAAQSSASLPSGST